MIKRDLLITIDDPFGEPAMRLITNDKGFVTIEMLEVNKNKFNIHELQTALSEINNFGKALTPQIIIPAGTNVTLFNLNQEVNEIPLEYKEGE